MKKNLPLFLLFIFNFCLAQEEPQVKFASTTNIVGNCDYGSTVYFTYKSADETKDINDSIKVTNGNNFVATFKIPQKVGAKNSIWAKYKKYKIKIVETKKEVYTILDDVDIVKRLTANVTNKENSYKDELSAINEFDAEKEALKNTTLVYKKTIVSTNFSIPLVRFNFIENDNTKKGDILLFNSIGAGIGIYGGRLERTRDNNGDIINEEFSNTIGFNIGAIFSAGTGEDTKNVFAPVLNLALLDFQIGIGTELGTKQANQKREFVTLSYAIPLYKLFKKGYRVFTSYDIPIESTRRAKE